MDEDGKKKEPATFSFNDVVAPAERDHIEQTRADSKQFDPRDKSKPYAGLAFSGGGIRSATFNLGILQALACAGKLGRFDYLSTVSGGGYIGGWLTAWIRRAGLEEVQKQLAHVAPGSREEPHEVRWLRAYSNYLTPRKGLLSLDTIWGGCTYVRNLVINQMLLAAFVLTVLFFGGFAHTMLTIMAQVYPWLVAGFGTALVLLAAPFLGFEFAHLRGQQPQPWSIGIVCWLQEGPAPRIIAILTVVGAILLAYGIPQPEIWYFCEVEPRWSFFERCGWGSLRYGLLFAAFWVIAWGSACIAFEPSRDTTDKNTVRIGLGIVLAIAVAAVAFAALQAWYAGLMMRIPAKFDWLIALVGPIGYVTVLEIPVLLIILLAGWILTPYAHDWLSRMAALVIVDGILPIAVFVVWLLLVPTIDYLSALPLSAAALGWAASTVAGVLGGRSASTGGKGPPPWWGKLIAVTPYIFLVGIFAILGFAARALIQSYGGAEYPATVIVAGNEWLSCVEQNLLRLGLGVDPGAWLPVTLVAIAVLLVLSWRVDINLFSFHSYYRNRLVHAYLGASAKDRRANAFTGYAIKDSEYMKNLGRTPAGEPARPFPLINTALNLTGSPRNEWQERKAASFLFSPLYCGFELPPILSTRRNMGLCKRVEPRYVHGYQPTADFVNGLEHRAIGQGIAITISGAAASPNMGYHTSKALAALMTVFNVRLGWWMPNPTHPDLWRAGGPQFSMAYFLAEFLGSCHEGSRYVYLSDGGHFENLGVYELLRRRCPLIVACDAGADAAFEYEDLGNLIRKARVDLLVDIEIDPEPTRPVVDERKVIGDSRASYVVGRITYPPKDEGAAPEKGFLVYVKSSVTHGAPADIDNYRRTHPGFPHQSTGDQWFDEGQFESYRRLGLEIGQTLLHDLNGPLGRDVGW